jgi:long-chain acyl-CoA synthetase
MAAAPDPAPARRRSRLDRREAARCGMSVAVTAAEDPERLAIRSPHGTRSFDALDARANQVARALRRAGLREGDSVALLAANRPEFVEVLYAGLRSGLRVTPINWHLTASEIAYVVADCEARAFVADARFAAAAAGAAAEVGDAAPLRLAVGGAIEGFAGYEAAAAAESPDELEDPALGATMLYTSGTTGRPKGVHREPVPPARTASARIIGAAIGLRSGEDLALNTGPLYHAAPLAFSLTLPLNTGVGVVVMDGWDAEETLRLVAEERITHTHLVPTMFHRLLALPEETKRRYDTASLRAVLHGAAPCPVHVKQRMLDWWGPVLFEYYAATEGWGSFVTPQQWLAKPGTVGRPEPGSVEIRDDEGKPCPPGVAGTVYLRAPAEGRFAYWKDTGKTARAYAGDFFTLGDVGYLDADGDLFLCDRSADVIISGGVNVYPAEVDAVLLTHPAVGDAATIGIPNEEWGEEVRAVVELAPGVAPSDALAGELVAFCRERLAHYKCPRAVDFTPRLPRLDSGKIQRRHVREPYWAGRERKI